MAAVVADEALEVRDLSTGYLGHAVVHGVTLHMPPGRVTCLFGHNGAGKTTTMKAIAGLNPTYSGSVRLMGEDVTNARPDVRVKKHLVYLPQERAVFRTLTVQKNLLLGATTVHDKAVIQQRLDEVVQLFPRLGERLSQIAGTMSGGEQRMLSMGIALMAGARVLMLDEPSLGLAPSINQMLLQTAERLAHQEGMAVVLVEQAIGQALEYADHVYVMRSGEIIAEHTREEALARQDWWEVF